ncbi:hypothetical protein BT93_H1103 [Corymbia citriodora subsp. variegata]|nr:hypothetical protein BT93_H1103 [Corymbia citriodora subsp. variegata]
MKKSCGIELSPYDNVTSFPVDEALGYASPIRTPMACPANAAAMAVTTLLRSAAKVAVYTTFLEPYSRIMGLNLPSGVHVTRGYDTSGIKKIYFKSIPFDINPSTGEIDYDKLEEKAFSFCPHLIICGSSAYPRDWDYARFCSIANKCGALLLCDMADVSGLIAAQEAANPFEHCEIVTTPPYKSLTGPTAGMIFYRKGQPEDAIYNFEDKTVISPSLLSGPHNSQVGVLAVALQQARSLEFKAYAKQVKANAVALGNYLLSKGYKLLTGGTDNHLILWDLRPLGLTGNMVEKLCNLCGITVKKKAVLGDSSAKAPRGVLIGTHAMTCMDFMEKDFEQIGEFLHRAVTITSTIQKQHGKLMKDFDKGLDNNEDIEALKVHVQKFSVLHRHAQFLSRP